MHKYDWFSKCTINIKSKIIKIYDSTYTKKQQNYR